MKSEKDDKMDKLAYRAISEKSFDEISDLLEKTSMEKGFRVLATHNVKETLADKGFEIDSLKIYEVCNAGFAYEALQKDINVSLFMPCKIVIRPDGDKTVLTLMRPTMISEMLPGSGVEELAADIEKKLIGIIDEIT
jgi:uncharacterized protein (DUF302 family)